MRRMYADVHGYCVIDRVESLPSRLPRMYHRHQVVDSARQWERRLDDESIGEIRRFPHGCISSSRAINIPMSVA
jgi:hypothetical protein